MGRRRTLDASVRRIDAARLRIENPHGVPVTLFANSEIPVEVEAVEQLLAFVSLQETLETLAGQERAGRISPFWGDAAGRLARVVVTPDFHLGSVGGGNHFVEIQAVEEVMDGATAHAWGLRPGAVAIMAHSGSVGLGHAVGGHFADRARALYPPEIRRPVHGFYVLPTGGPHAAVAREYLDALRNAANFAFGNRLMLGLMVLGVLSEVAGRRGACGRC